MPGSNCCIPGCGATRREKYDNVGMFSLPKNDEINKQWRRDMINIITRDRIVDEYLKKRIDANKVKICSLHFNKDEYWDYGTRKILKDGVLPTKNLPQKTMPSHDLPSRSTSAVTKREVCQLAEELNADTCDQAVVYEDFHEFRSRVGKLKLHDLWQVKIEEDLVTVLCISKLHILPKFEIYVDYLLNICIRVFGWMLPAIHPALVSCSSTFFNITLSNFIKQIEKYVICTGVSAPDASSGFEVMRHIIPLKFNFREEHQNKVTHQDEFLRANDCQVLVMAGCCSPCKSRCVKLRYDANRKAKQVTEPARLKAPVKFTSPERLKLTLQEQRLQCKQLQDQIQEMKLSIEKCSKTVSPELGQDFKTLFSGVDQKRVPPFMKLFWEEQQKYIKSSCPSSVRYHPMVIKYCLSLAMKSSSAYNDLRYDSKTGSGVLILPSLRTLRDYKNYIRPTRGLNPKIIEELAEKTSTFSKIEQYVTILFDEMKIQEDLVWDKHSGELIGFVDLGDVDVNETTLKDTQEIATHVLVFLVKSIINPLSYSIATYATTGATCTQLFPIFWKAVAALEGINLKVVAATADGASANRAFFKMHKGLDSSPANKVVVYRAENIFASEKRYIYFFADVPHLIKTSRNCLSHSGVGRGSRFMWNNGCYILWTHITKMYYDDLSCGLKLMPKLTTDHVNLTPYSVMRVRLAAQILSETVGVVLREYGGPESKETAKFCLMMDMFFDCLNVRNLESHKIQRKPNLAPYRDHDDARFKWLDEFLEYFESWKNSIEKRPSNFTAQDRANMFISWQTYEGLQITVHSFKEVCKYLFQQGVPYILSEKFCQDVVENYFGRQRAIGRRRDNPSVRDVGFNDNAIRNQFSVRSISGGNVTGKFDTFIDDSSLPKRRRTCHKNNDNLDTDVI